MLPLYTVLLYLTFVTTNAARKCPGLSSLVLSLSLLLSLQADCEMLQVPGSHSIGLEKFVIWNMVSNNVLARSSQGPNCGGLGPPQLFFSLHTLKLWSHNISAQWWKPAATLQFWHNVITCLAFPLGPVEIHTRFIIHAVHTNEPSSNRQILSSPVIYSFSQD